MLGAFVTAQQRRWGGESSLHSDVSFASGALLCLGSRPAFHVTVSCSLWIVNFSDFDCVWFDLEGREI